MGFCSRQVTDQLWDSGSSCGTVVRVGETGRWGEAKAIKYAVNLRDVF